MGLIAKKLVDYGWTESDFKDMLSAKLEMLDHPETREAFKAEMSRFVDTVVARQLVSPQISGRFLSHAKEQGQAVLKASLSLDSECDLSP